MGSPIVAVVSFDDSAPNDALGTRSKRFTRRPLWRLQPEDPVVFICALIYFQSNDHSQGFNVVAASKKRSAMLHGRFGETIEERWMQCEQ